jgi:hypothetical protein
MSAQQQTPDLSEVPTQDLCGLMLACSCSNDKSDRDFVKACRDEIARRKPEAASKGGGTNG